MMLETEVTNKQIPEPQDEVAAVIQDYFDGAKGKVGVLSRAFYSSCNLHSLTDDGRHEIVPRDRFIGFAEAGKLPPHTSEIMAMDVVGDMAYAKVCFQFERHAFVDVLTLLRIEGRFRIVSKVYTRLEFGL